MKCPICKSKEIKRLHGTFTTIEVDNEGREMFVRRRRAICKQRVFGDILF